MSNRNVPVTVFNASASSLQISVNRGNPASIAGTGPGQNWSPQQPTPNPFSFSEGYAEPNKFGYRENMLLVIVDGMPIGEPAVVNIPMTRIDSLQLYIFLADSSVSWTLLNNGRVISSGQR